MRSLALLAVIVVAPGVAAAEHAPLTHTSPLTPTGELLPAGRVERIQSLVAFHHELAVGLADGLELRLSTPGVPIPMFGGDLQLRASVTPPASRLRVVLGAGLAAEWVNGGDLWVGASTTVAWRGDRWGAHATLRALEHRLETGDRLLVTTAGVTARVGRRATLFAEVGEIAWLQPVRCMTPHGSPASCVERDTVGGVLIGSWWQLRDLAVSVQGLVGWSGDAALPIGPLLAFRWDRDL